MESGATKDWYQTSRKCCSTYPHSEHLPECPARLAKIERERVLKDAYAHRGMDLDAVMTPTPSVLLEAEKIINGERREEYGPTTVSFQRIADLWSATLGTPVDAQQVALCLIQLKVARSLQDVEKKRPIKRDSLVDIAGYAGCLEKIGRGE